MPVYREAPGVWRVKIWKANRVQSWKVRGPKSAAEAFEARKRLELAVEVDRRSAVPTFLRFLLDEYLPHAELRLKPAWLRNQRYTLATLGAELGELPITDISTAVLEAFARGRVNGRRKPVTVNNEMRILRRVLNYARKLGVLATVPAWEQLPERGETRARAWTRAQVDALIEAGAKKAPEILPIVVFLANTGCRAGEALALTWDHVDLAHGLIHVWPSAAWQPKSGRPREVPIADALLPWLQLPRTSPYVFPSLHGKRAGQRRTSWPARLFNLARAAAGLKGGPHTLRHTYASHFLATTPDLALLAEVLGHSDTAVTRLYKHLLPDHLARARNAVQMAGTPAAAEALAMARWRGQRNSMIDETKFWGWVDKSGDCWVWTAARKKDGYGWFHVGPKKKLAHRVAWELAHGEPPPDGLLVLHSCDNPPCVRPEHLRLGTNADNAADRVARGRSNPAMGESNGHAKLTAAQVVAIRERVSSGKHGIKAELAREYGVSESAISKIENGTKWKSVPDSFPDGYIDEAQLEEKTNDSAERATGFEPATSSLGSSVSRPKILKLLSRK